MRNKYLISGISATIFFLFVFLGCHKIYDASFNSNTNNNVESIKKEFEKKQYGDWFLTKINDTSSAIKKPDWQYSNQRQVNGDTYTYIPISISGNSTHRQNIPVTIIGVKEYLLAIQKKNDEINFYLLRYVFDPSKTKGLSDTFTGNLLMIDLKTQKIRDYNFVNGQTKGTSANTQVQSLEINKPMRTCETVYVCDFVNTSCYANWIFTTTHHVGTSCICPGYGLQRPNGETCYDNGCGSGGVWFLSNSTTIENCWEDDPYNPPPQTPPAQPNNYPYARIEMTNENLVTWYEGDVYREERTYDVYMRFYSDASCTTPIGISTSVVINYAQNEGYINSMGPGNGSWSEYYFLQNPSSSITQIFMGNKVSYTYQLAPDPYYGQVSDETDRTWEVIAGNGYNAVSTLYY